MVSSLVRSRAHAARLERNGARCQDSSTGTSTTTAVEQEIKTRAGGRRPDLRATRGSRRVGPTPRRGRACPGRLGNFGGLVERDAIVFQASRRLASLDAAHDGLVFGRLDLRDGETRYVGRLGLRNADRDVLLVDWRAPAAAVFYQATAQDPAGVVRRRVLQSFTDRVIGVEDDLLDPEHAPEDMVVVGEGALMAALSRTPRPFDAVHRGDHPEGAGRGDPGSPPWRHD